METKICPQCKLNLPATDFYKRGKFSFSWCKSCLCDKQSKRWIDRKLMAVKLLGGQCSKCGYNKNYAALQFHHLDPSEKEFNWTKLKLRAWGSILKELEKCQLLCANCHFETHWPNAVLNYTDLQDNNSLNNEPKPTGKCPCCETDVFGTKYCSQACAKNDRRKVMRPSKEELALLIKSESYCAIGRKFKVSDNAIRKWARHYGII